MEPDLQAPLGQNRPTGRRRFRPSANVLVGLLVVGGLVGFSIYTMRARPPGAETGHVVAHQANGVPSAGVSATSLPPQEAQVVTLASGAIIERTLTDDGKVVTRFSPYHRGKDGPAIVNPSQTGQDPRLAGTPNEDLLETSQYGLLPIVGSDGLRPMDQYARPWSGARGTRIAIIVGGLGLSQTGTQRAINQLSGEITLAFAATGNSLQRWMQNARRKGHEVLLQVPMEPFSFSSTERDPNILLAGARPEDNLAQLHQAMARITGYTGIMNHLGGRLLSDSVSLEPLLRDIARRGLLFLDDGSSASSTTNELAEALALPHGFADLTLDTDLSRGAILKKLDELERIAFRKGSAIGVASAFDESVDAIAQWLQESRGRGIEVVGVSSLVEDPEKF